VTYTVLARSWRPQRFADLIGQDAVVRTLQNSLGSGTFAQAYLFSGLRGVGKTTAARLLAKAVNCERGPTAEPCGECDSCREITDGASLDVVEIDGATNTQVDKVRDLQDLLRFRPTRDRYRVIVIDEVHMLSTSAFNALLKSIEEPPPYVLWIFATTERHKVPATILSRCQELDFRPLPAERLAAHLEKVAAGEKFGLSPGAAAAIARAAEGSVRDGLSLLDQLRAFSGDAVDEAAVETVLGIPPMERILGLIESLASGDLRAALALLRDQLARGDDPSVLAREVGRVLGVLLHLAVDPSLEPDLTGADRERVARTAAEIGAQGLGRMLSLWLEAEGLLREATNRELALEVAALRLSRWPAVQRLEAMLADGTELSPRPEGGGGGGNAPPSTPSPAAPTGGGAGGGPPATRLGEALWPTHPRLAAAVESAEVRLEGPTLVLRFPAEARSLARFADGERARLEEAARGAIEGCSAVRVEEQEPGDDALSALERAVAEDPGVDLVRRVLGGEVRGVWPDRDTS